jgi:transposase
MAGKYKAFTPEFREEVAKLVIETSRAIADVAREYGVNETTVGNWVRAYREKHGEAEQPLSLPERARLRELERKNRELVLRRGVTCGSSMGTLALRSLPRLNETIPVITGIESPTSSMPRDIGVTLTHMSETTSITANSARL